MGIWRRTRTTILGLIAMLALVAPSLDAQQAAEPADSGVVADGVFPGDQIVLKIWREPDMSGEFIVDTRGEVVLPRLGRVQVMGRSALALQDSLRAEFSRYLREPAIDIAVLRRVGVQGEVRKPDLYMVDLTMTLRDVLSQAGGVTETGNPRRIMIVRDGEQIRLGKGDSARFSAAELRSGDQVVVGRRSWFEINSLAIASTAAVVVSVIVPIIRSF
jgi:polysaccharide export outer membrane protein